MTESKNLTFADVGITVKNGDTFLTTCPNCSHLRKKENQKKDCLKVWNLAENKGWNCAHCGWTGRLNTWEQYKEVYASAKMPKQLPSVFSREITAWLESRGLSIKTALYCRCYEVHSPSGMELAFPYYFQNTLRNVMFRRVNQKAIEQYGKVRQIPKDKGTQTIFWGLDELDFSPETGADYIIITEGQPDRMTWIECGYKNVLSVPMGAPDPKTKNLEKRLEFLNDDFRSLIYNKDLREHRAKKIYLATDGDANGLFLQQLLAERLGKTRCWNIDYPSGYKDSNEVLAGDSKKGLKALGKEGIDQLFSTASPQKISGVISIYDVISQIKNLSQGGHEKGLSFGHEAIDNHISLKRKILMTITGIPGMSKSTVSRFLTTECSRQNDVKWGLYTPENRPVYREYAKLTEVYSRQNLFNTWGGERTQMPYEIQERSYAWVNEHMTIIDPKNKSFENFGVKDAKPTTIKSIFKYFKHLKDTKGIFGIVIDAWNKLDHERPNGMPETEYISQQLDLVLEFLDVNDLCGIIIAHPAKQERQKGGNFEVPTLYDIKGSSAWFEKVDIGLSVHRMLYKNLNKGVRGAPENWVVDKSAPTQVHVQKMKFDELGQLGKWEMWLDRSKGDTFTFNDPNLTVSKKPSDITVPHNEPYRASDDLDDLPF